MKIIEIFLLSWDSLKLNKLRTGLTIAIITIGISALISILTVIEVFRWNIFNNFSGMGVNTFTIMNNKQSKGNNNGLFSEKISFEETSLFKNNFKFPCIISASFIADRGVAVHHNKQSSNQNIIVMATDENYLTVSATNLSVGRNFNKREIINNDRICILGSSVAKKIFTNIKHAENAIVRIKDFQYRVTGVMESKGASFINRLDNMVLISLSNGNEFDDADNKSFVLSVFVPDIKQLLFAMDEAEGLMRIIKKLNFKENNNFKINKNNEMANALIGNIKTVTLSASIIGIITLFGASIGLMNMLLASVVERTREIGVLKSIGANNKNIFYQFLIESIMISLFGGILGIVIGMILGNILSIFFQSPFIIPWIWMLSGFIICLLVGITAGIYPSFKASKLNPIDCLRST